MRFMQITITLAFTIIALLTSKALAQNSSPDGGSSNDGSADDDLSSEYPTDGGFQGLSFICIEEECQKQCKFSTLQLRGLCLQGRSQVSDETAFALDIAVPAAVDPLLLMDIDISARVYELHIAVNMSPVLATV
ncbi:hypothetical protein BCR43DRAFT_504019 [Syncephalastrum racemosum]|uniref:Uncharacterized protein n=1 Tax=Syncephalastrum racemosum TaxID=13706 RepID=A0A1X2HJP9_SYNRA|nr:hypothetical protein BCR43DRAFT_504019 [Syncephalastrum racemosum]